MSKRLAFLFAVALCAAPAACGKTAPVAKVPVSLEASERVPGAMGTVDTMDGGNGNTHVTVRVKHVAAPQKLNSGATTYVVWVRPVAANGKVQSLGALKVDADESGSLDAVTALDSFEVFITPEASTAVQTPTGERILTGRVDVKP